MKKQRGSAPLIGVVLFCVVLCSLLAVYLVSIGKKLDAVKIQLECPKEDHLEPIPLEHVVGVETSVAAKDEDALDLLADDLYAIKSTLETLEYKVDALIKAGMGDEVVEETSDTMMGTGDLRKMEDTLHEVASIVRDIQISVQQGVNQHRSRSRRRPGVDQLGPGSADTTSLPDQASQRPDVLGQLASQLSEVKDMANQLKEGQEDIVKAVAEMKKMVEFLSENKYHLVEVQSKVDWKD